MWFPHWSQELNTYKGLCQMEENFIQQSFTLHFVQSMWFLHWLQEPNKYMGLCQMVENFIQHSYELLKTTTYIGSIRKSIPPLVYSIGRINLLMIWELIIWTHWVIQALWYSIISFERSYLGCALSKMISWLIKSMIACSLSFCDVFGNHQLWSTALVAVTISCASALSWKLL